MSVDDVERKENYEMPVKIGIIVEGEGITVTMFDESHNSLFSPIS